MKIVLLLEDIRFNECLLPAGTRLPVLPASPILPLGYVLIRINDLLLPLKPNEYAPYGTE